MAVDMCSPPQLSPAAVQRAGRHGPAGGGPRYGDRGPDELYRVGAGEDELRVLPDRLLAAQVPAHLPHAGPRLRPSLAAHEAQPQHQLRRLLVVHGAPQVAADAVVPDGAVSG